jgi:hypothetical protein
MLKTDEDVLRELLHRATDDLHAPSAVTAGIVTGHQRRLRNTRLLSITTTSVAAAALVAAVVVSRAGPAAPSPAQHPGALPATQLPATQLPPVKLTAAQVLDQLSVAAAHASEPAGRYIALTEINQQDLSEQMTVFDGLTGDIWMYQRATVNVPGDSMPSSFPVLKHGSPTRAEFAAWPTNPAKLRALLLHPDGMSTSEAEIGGPGVTETANDLVFDGATSWLWDPLLSPALRAAMYKVLAATPGVEVKTGVKDSIGRPAIEISRQDNVSGWWETTFESPTTGAVLEQDFTDVGNSVYVSVTGYATLPPNPYTSH